MDTYALRLALVVMLLGIAAAVPPRHETLRPLRSALRGLTVLIQVEPAARRADAVPSTTGTRG